VVREEYRGRWRQREEIDGIDVLRGWLYASPNRPTLSKSLGYASFATSACLWAALGRLRADIVIATSPPPTVAIPGMFASRLLRAPLLFDVRDIWPEAVVESGRLNRGPVVRCLEAVERAVYRAATAVTVVTEGKLARLLEKGVPEEKLSVIPNGVDLANFAEERPVAGLLSAHAVDHERFTIMYAGIFGPSQGLDVLFDAALHLRREAPETAERIQFVLVGGGVERARLEERHRSEGLGELVRMLPEQPRENIPSLLRAANAIAVTLRPRKDSHTVPSKIYESMASGHPVLVSANGAPAEILEESGAGYATPASDAPALAESIRKLVDDPAACRSFGERGQAYAARFDRRRLVEEFEEVLMAAVERHATKRG
jgi:glycosyltransferase involved in cell wall biosynthesis